jgi:hypothetical protein
VKLMSRPTSMTTPLTLNCWVFGTDSNHIFSIEIDRNENVGDLRQAIKEKTKPSFDHIDANNIDVWNVSIPVDEHTNLQAKVNDLRLHEKKPLWPLEGLLKIFIVSTDFFFSLCHSYLFAVVGTPAPSLLRLNCWVLGENSTRIFPVEIDRNENVGGLKEAIKEENKSSFDHITANSLDVWNVSIPVDKDTNLQAQVKNLKVLEKKCLLPVQPLFDIFQNVVEQYLHVIVRTSTSECSPDFCLSSSNNMFLCRCRRPSNSWRTCRRHR